MHRLEENIGYEFKNKEFDIEYKYKNKKEMTY